MYEWQYYFFCWSSNVIKPLAPVSKDEERLLFFIKRKTFDLIAAGVSNNIKPSRMNILFLDTNYDLDGQKCLECIEEKFGRPDADLKPVLIIANSTLENGNIEIDRRKAFLDSSIWFRYISELSKQELERVFSFFKSKQEIYKTNVAKEYVSFYSGLLPVSKLRIKGAHANCVSPYIFHSESKMKHLAEEPESDEPSLIKVISSAGLKWRILLADDYASKNLASIEDRQDDKSLTKENIIKNILDLKEDGSINHQESVVDRLVEEKDIPSSIVIESIQDKSCIEDILRYLNGQKNDNRGNPQSFDIILLDYLLGEIEDADEKPTGKREYGYELFHYLFKKPLKNKQPLMGKYWIMNISSFDTAMTDRIREQGYTFNNEVWNMSRGGDPVNTPELFRYMLLRMMEMQINQALGWSQNFDGDTLPAIIQIVDSLYNAGNSYPLKRDVLRELRSELREFSYSAPDAKDDQAEKKERDEEQLGHRLTFEDEHEQYVVRFEKIAEVFATLQQLRQDYKNGSAFAGSVLEKLDDDDREQDKLRILSHYRELLYQLSFHSTEGNPSVLIETQKLRVLIQRYQRDYGIK